MAKAVTVDFNANIAKFTSSVDKASADLNRFQSNAKRVASNIKGAFAGLAAGLTVVAMGRFVQRTIDAQDELAKMSDRTGFAVETLAGLQHAADLSGTSLAAME